MDAAASLIAVDLEQALLGAILHDPDVLDRIDGELVGDDFSDPINRQLYDSFTAAHQAGDRIDVRLAVAMLGEDAKKQITSELTVGHYIARLCAEAVSIDSAKSYARKLRDLADKRRSVEVAERLKVAVSGSRSVTELAVEAIEDLDAIVSMRAATHQSAIAGRAAAERVVETMTIRMQNPGTITGISTGFTDLDAKTSGYQRGELTIIAGRPSMGKSAFALSSARQSEANVQYFSLEMTAEALMRRAITDAIYDHRDPIAYSDIIAGKITDAQAQRVVDGQRELQFPVEIDPQAGLSVQQIAARARKHQQFLRRKGAEHDVVIVDHLHIMASSERYRGNKTYEITEITAGLKALAKDLNVAVVALAQLNRAVEGRDDKRPTLSDLRESGSIEQDADVVMFVFREAYYLRLPRAKPADEDARVARLGEVKNRLDIDIAKFRNGPTGTVTLFFDAATNAVRNWSRAA